MDDKIEKKLSLNVIMCFRYKGELYITDELIFKGQAIVIFQISRKEII